VTGNKGVSGNSCGDTPDLGVSPQEFLKNLYFLSRQPWLVYLSGGNGIGTPVFLSMRLAITLLRLARPDEN
jgi:hypothetical protein